MSAFGATADFGLSAHRLGWALACTFAILGCDVKLPEGSFRCEADDSCPTGWVCREDRRCYSNPSDESPASEPREDGGSTLDGSPDVVIRDAQVDAAGPIAEPPQPEPDDEDAGGRDAGMPPHPEPKPEPDPTPPAPALGVPCTVAGERTCTGQAQVDKLFCSDGHWVHNGTCDGSNRCDTRPGATRGTCQPIVALCLDKSPGVDVCDGATRRRCNADLVAYEEHACPMHAQCMLDGDAVRCACDSGYRDDGNGSCVDIEDCAPGVCGAGSCVDGLNTYTCSCDHGFMSNGTTCVDVPDCPTSDPCKPHGSCVDGREMYGCSCDSGYIASGQSCVRATTCPAPDPCAATGGICIGTSGGWVCDCGPCGSEFDGQCLYDPCCNGGCG